MLSVSEYTRRIPVKLVNLRKERNLSQSELAKFLEVSNGAIAMYETGRRVPSDKVKVRYADFFGKTVQELFYNSEEDST